MRSQRNNDDDDVVFSISLIIKFIKLPNIENSSMQFTSVPMSR